MHPPRDGVFVGAVAWCFRSRFRPAPMRSRPRSCDPFCVQTRLSQGLFATTDDEDEELVSRYTCHAAKAGDGTCFAVTKIRMHRLIMNAPAGVYVDHIKGCGLTNTRENFRLATNAENQANTKKRG